jgi:hypothetical protein
VVLVVVIHIALQSFPQLAVVVDVSYYHTRLPTDVIMAKRIPLKL